MGGHFRKERSHQRDCGQEVFDGEVRDDNLILCYDARNAIFGNSFHDIKRRRMREKRKKSGGMMGKPDKKKWGNPFERVSIYVIFGNTRLIIDLHSNDRQSIRNNLEERHPVLG